MQYGPTFFYLWPPRPKTTIKPFSPQYEAMKGRKWWKSQLKLNGQRNVIYISPDREVQMWNRHGDTHQNYNVPPWLVEQVLSVVKPVDGWVAIDGELLHAKDKSIKNTLYWWDMLVYDSDYLIGRKYNARHQMLLDAVREPISNDGHIAKVTDNIWLACMIEPEQFDAAWSRTEISYVEGFVFKDVNSALRPCLGRSNNHSWQVRCRKPHPGGCYRH